MRFRHSSQRVFGAEQLDPRLRAGLIGWWSGDGSGLTLRDRSGYGRHGTLTNGPTWTLGAEGRANALLLDGSNDYVAVGAHALHAPAQLTVAVRARATSAPVLYDSLIGKSSTANWNDGWGLYFQSGSEVRFWVNDEIGTYASAPIAPLDWRWVVGTWDGATIRVYVDGAAGTPGAYAGAATGAAASLEIGRTGGYTGGMFDGAVEQALLYDRALSVAEVMALARGPQAIPTARRRLPRLLVSLSLTPAPADVALAAVAPTVIAGGEIVAPSAAEVALAAVAPTVVLGSLAIVPAAASVVFAAVAPTIPPNYADWLALDAASCVVLAEAQPAEILRGWTATSGRPNTYEVAWSPFAQAALVGGGGVYRRLDSVEVDGVDLTERASIADVDGNLGSWYLDPAAELLYVSLDPAADPDSSADVVLAEFTIFMATDAKDFEGGELYEPRLTGALPTVRAESDDPLFGVKTYPGGTFEVANADGFFDALTRDWVWRNRPVTFYLGGGSMARSDYAAVATVVIEDMAPNDSSCRFRVRAAASALDQQLPPNVYDSTVGDLLGEGVSGTYRPLLYGAVSDIPAPLVVSTGGAQVYEIADPTLQVLTAVSEVVAVSRSGGTRTVLTPTTDYTVDLTGCRVTVVAKVATPAAPTVTARGTTGATAYSYKIVARNELGVTLASAAGTVANGNATLSISNCIRLVWAAVPGADSYDVYGRTSGSEQLLASEIRATTWDDDGSLTPSGSQPSAVTAFRYNDGTHEIRVTATGETDGAGGYLSTGGEILRDLLGVLGVPSSSIEAADFSTADTDAPYPLGLWIRDRRAAAQYVRLVEASNLASLFVDSEGMWRYRVWEPTGDSTALPALADEDFAEWEPDARIESLFAEVHARYAPNPASGDASVAKAENPVVRYAYRERGVLLLETVLLSVSHAEVIAQRSLLIAGSPSIEVRVRERGLSSMTLNVRDRVSVTRARGPVSGGVLEGVVMDVLEVSKSLGPPGVSMRLGDMWGLTARIGTIVDASAPSWGAATEAERNVSGFITDANGLADSGDPTTANHSIFW